MLQNCISGHEKTRLLEQSQPGAGRWLCFTTIRTRLACKTIPGPQNCYLLLPASPVLPALCREANGCILPRMNKCILSTLIYKYSHTRVYVSRTVLESRRCFFLLTYFKYLCSMDFDSSCSWFCDGLDLALSETILKPLRNMNSIWANLRMDVYMCVRELISNMCKILRQCCRNDYFRAYRFICGVRIVLMKTQARYLEALFQVGLGSNVLWQSSCNFEILAFVWFNRF